MESNAKRFSSRSPTTKVGPADYDTLNYKAKESFNYG